MKKFLTLLLYQELVKLVYIGTDALNGTTKTSINNISRDIAFIVSFFALSIYSTFMFYYKYRPSTNLLRFYDLLILSHKFVDTDYFYIKICEIKLENNENVKPFILDFIWCIHCKVLHMFV